MPKKSGRYKKHKYFGNLTEKRPNQPRIKIKTVLSNAQKQHYIRTVSKIGKKVIDNYSAKWYSLFRKRKHISKNIRAFCFASELRSPVVQAKKIMKAGRTAGRPIINF
ncbi:hypothetical protein A7X67_15790 [Clostridium sp. W14A]|nr:hypothetical protein A7X67_15790 [Clostridium sp. W14A]